MEEYTFKRLSEDQLNVLQLLFKQSFEKDVSLKFLQRKYNTSIFGKEYIGFIAYHRESGEPAAYYGVFPQKVIVSGSIMIAGQSGDTMTAPKHRKKGLFIKLAKLTYKLASEEGLAFIYGFPNSHSYRGFEKLGWHFTGKMLDFKISVKALPLALIIKKFGLFNKVQQVYIDKVTRNLKNNPVNSNILNTGTKSKTQVYRNLDYFNYKKHNHAILISFEKIQVWVKIDGTMQIGDVDENAVGNEQRLINFLKKLAAKLGCTKIIFSISENHKLAQGLADIKKPTQGLDIGFLNLDPNTLIPFEDFSFTIADFDTF